MKRISFKDSAFGWDGLTTFVFSNVLILLTLGAFLWWLIYRVLYLAITARIDTADSERQGRKLNTVLVAGLCLEHNQPVEAFKVRLRRAIELQNLSLVAEKKDLQVIVLGGVTGNSSISEAQAGARYLIEQGMPEQQIILEQQSRHTLENMQHARMLLQQQNAVQDCDSTDIAVITSRYHLYRLLTLARGLGMILLPVAAEDSFDWSTIMLLRVIKEAYYLHWYWSGKLWVFLTASQKSKARII